MNSEITICECTATEDDWLDISYSQRHYIREEDNALDLIRKRNGRHKKAPKKAKRRQPVRKIGNSKQNRRHDTRMRPAF